MNHELRTFAPYMCRSPAALAILVTLPACVVVEFDRMTGTTFPSDQMIDGDTYSIGSIYVDAGLWVTVDEDDTTIAPLVIDDDDCISDAELDALETGNRDSPLFPSSNRHHLYGIVVDHHAELVVDGCEPDFVVGKMWDHHTRAAFALFYPHSTIQSSGAEYLRTTVHEMGHAFNLQHEDGDGSTTIMVKSGDISADWVYEFSANSQNHFQNHPIKCKFPGAVGGAPFTWVIEEHHVKHPDVSTSFNCN